MMMLFKMEFLWTDILLYAVVIILFLVFLISLRKVNIKNAWRYVFHKPLTMSAFIIILSFLMIALLDSIHYRIALPQHENHKLHYSPKIYSVLDYLLSPIGVRHEKTYAAPFASHLYIKELESDQQLKIYTAYPKLNFIDDNIHNSAQKNKLIMRLIVVGSIVGILTWLIIMGILVIVLSWMQQKSVYELWSNFKSNKVIAWKTAAITTLVIFIILTITLNLAYHFYIFGTDKIGQDVFYLTVKSIRTGIIIGTITSLSMLPFALFLGILAGYFGGITDSIIQYIYTTLSSIPGVLLITAAVLSLQVFISTHPQYFYSLDQIADARLLALCLILGFTSWTGLCRLLRAETLKIRETDYIQAARALGSSNYTIIFKHIIPNVMHIVLITTVLDFSFLILAEALLSYVGVGVSPTTISWGNIINSARLELAREPIVWWPMIAAFIFMFVLVLSGNIFADAVRDAFDPRAEHL